MGVHPVNALDELRGWKAPGWNGLRALVTGLGVTGFSAADTLAELGAEVIVVDAKSSEKKQNDAETLRIVGVKGIRFGEEATSSIRHFADGAAPDLVITSPGWRPDSALISAAAEAGVPVWSDIQLAHRLGPRPEALAARGAPVWLTVTGTNGKTTTVSLLEQMLIADGRRAAACGNIGMPILDAVRDPEGFDALAVELSSFQLHYTEPLDATASAVLNIAEDHVDWHGTRQSYAADKAKIYERTRVACVYNAADAATGHMVAGADVVEGCRAISFAADTPEMSQLGLVLSEDGAAGEDGGGILVDRAYLDNRRHEAIELATLADFNGLAPKHLVENALAAAALARAAGVAPESVRAGIRAYEAGDHRIQPVAKQDGILWVNDSKATNPHAARASLAAFGEVVWIAGGLPKGMDYDALVESVGGRLRHVILLGTDSSQLAASLARHAPQVPVTAGFDGEDGEQAMAEAVAAAHREAQPGQTVLLSPAAASMDQFASYAARGEAFIRAVAAMIDHDDE
ncbi:UDP-N-acetylmuramoyl-L-alanine--D-glutamate ligase [Nesterenkonia populi]|uniref:UDP-N-acetylmuramoyl-L-alanine--D-glutamate ligase n=1 Tax=Nesterenkonia populi TaxID=1591087 RepID=UPI0011BD6876|nr:UDP-N-acetylmuramoyl-L-alanine--D-glutamate ligase [Nesterenkonia populi]